MNGFKESWAVIFHQFYTGKFGHIIIISWFSLTDIKIIVSVAIFQGQFGHAWLMHWLTPICLAAFFIIPCELLEEEKC